jgi:ligand-binding SRPBCC domain-containing protein
MAFYQFTSEQKIPASIDQVWDFIATPMNLRDITPEYMGFEVTSQQRSDKMYPGMIISYKVSPLLGIKMTWVTEITQVKDRSYFVDEQRIGPYAMWHHEHQIEAIEGGVLMSDIVSYQPPFGFLGAIANTLMIRNKLKEIFEFRTKAVEKKFGKF